MGTQAKEEKKNWPMDKDVIRLSVRLSSGAGNTFDP